MHLISRQSKISWRNENFSPRAKTMPMESRVESPPAEADVAVAAALDAIRDALRACWAPVNTACRYVVGKALQALAAALDLLYHHRQPLRQAGRACTTCLASAYEGLAHVCRSTVAAAEAALLGAASLLCSAAGSARMSFSESLGAAAVRCIVRCVPGAAAPAKARAATFRRLAFERARAWSSDQCANICDVGVCAWMGLGRDYCLGAIRVGSGTRGFGPGLAAGSSIRVMCLVV